MNNPKRQSDVNRDINAILRQKVPEKQQFVWAVYNSGDPLWAETPYAIELVLFATKLTAMDFVRALLKEHWNIDTTALADQAVEDLMWTNDDERYLHLYELIVHPDEYWTVNLPFASF